MYMYTSMLMHTHTDVDIKPYSSVPALVSHREAKPEIEPANSDAAKGINDHIGL